MRRALRTLRPATRRDRGVILPLTALLLVTLLVFVAFAVDLGRLTLERRRMQADADLIALDLVRLADGRTEDAILASADYATVLARTAAANGIAVADLTVNYGNYDLATDTFTPTSGSQVPYAVEVRADADIDFFFARVINLDRGTTNRTAIAGLSEWAWLELGSNTLQFDTADSAALNFLVNNTVGGSVSLSAVTYDSLASTGVTVDQIAAAAGVATTDELLSSDVTAYGFALLVADALRNNGQPSQAAAIEAIAVSADATATFTVASIFGATVGQPPSVAGINFNALGRVLAAAQIASQQNAANICTSAPGLGALLPGGTLQLCTSIVEGPYIAQGAVGDNATTEPAFRTAQIRTTATASAPVSLSLGGVLSVSGGLDLPVTLTGGGAGGTLTDIDCDNLTTDTSVRPRPIDAVIGGPTPVTSLTVSSALGPVATIAVGVDKTVTPTTPVETLVDDQLVGTTESAAGSGLDLGLDPINNSDVTLTVTAGTLPAASLSALKALLLPTLNTALAAVNVAGTPLLNQLGFGISTSDLELIAIDCNDPILRR